MSQQAFVAIIDLDFTMVLSSFTGLDPVKLAGYLASVNGTATAQIKKSGPDAYEVRGELHRIAWLKNKRTVDNALGPIFHLLWALPREIQRTHEAATVSLGSPKLHAGLSFGKVDITPAGLSGEAVRSALDCAEKARKSDATLVITSEFLRDLPTEIVGELCADSPLEAFAGHIAIQQDILKRVVYVQKRPPS